MSAEPPAEPRARAEQRVRVMWRGRSLELEASASLFSSRALDPGTALLLQSLPDPLPQQVLDLGCGYGAIGLAVAASAPASHVTLVDRDLLAVEAARRNVARAGLENVTVRAGLGLEGLEPPARGFDLVVANLPARAGERVLSHLLVESLRRLARGGEIRVVLIGPLVSGFEASCTQLRVACERAVEGAGHVVLVCRDARGPGEALPAPDGDPYRRDEIVVSIPGLESPLELVRPTDLADEPHRLPELIPLLGESLPRSPGGLRRALVFRAGYGLLAAALLRRYPEIEVVAQDRDLLGLAFTARNCSFGASRLRTLASHDLAAAGRQEPFDLVVGELSPPLGVPSTLAELRAARALLAPGGLALVAGLKKLWRELRAAGAGEWLRTASGKTVEVATAARGDVA